MKRLPDTPVLRSTATLLPAAQYNRIHLGVNRLGTPLQIMLPGRRGFAIVVERDYWLCVDRNLGNMPMLAWTDFHRGRRRGIHEPVGCRLVYYHAYANVLVRTLLEDVARIVEQRLRRATLGRRGRIVAFGPASRRRAGANRPHGPHGPARR